MADNHQQDERDDQNDRGDQGDQNTGGARTRSFPSAMTVLAIVTILVWIAAFFIPSGEYQRNDAGNPVQGTYHRISSPLSFGGRVSNLAMSPVNGLYGIQDAKSGQVSTENDGSLYGSVGVFFFVLAIGAFITVLFATGALDTGIGRLAHRLRERGALLITAIMAVFALLGSVEGWSEETLGFYGLIVPLSLALGYDRMVAVAAILLSSGIGVLCSTMNPFAIGVASSAAGISIGDGIVLRGLMLVVLTAVTIAFVLRYASRVRTDPAHSVVGFLPGDHEVAAGSAQEPPPLTSTQKSALIATGLTFALMIFSVIPWASVITGKSDAAAYSWQLDWSFPQLAAMFLLAGVAIGVIARMNEAKLTGTIISGAADFISPALVVALARGITVIMNNAKITDTVLHALEGAVHGTTSAVFSVLVFVVNLPLAFLIPSTSGHATLVMPIMAPLAAFANVPKSLVVTAWCNSNGFMNLFVPTSAVIMGGLTLAKVGYDKYIRFILPYLAVMLVMICGFLAIGAAVG
ncbi:YfcC family protein [Catenulispora rubra]|uniref:YfcC family protein n=1 Tax=Catenulispora rubra TaxID=280293 RepID=UPI00189221BF|nr:YfcC family protein [Catenulispora rubra]